MRYCNTQTKSYTCAPIAVLNALKWVGYNKTIKDLPHLISLLRCNKFGTFHTDITRTLKKYSSVHFSFNEYKKLNIEYIIEHCLDGGSVILSFLYKKQNTYGHVVFISGYKNKKFCIHNFSSYKEITHKALDKLIKNTICQYPHLWLIKRKKT